MTKPDGGPAFPPSRDPDGNFDYRSQGSGRLYESAGMSLRDYFAAQFLGGLAASRSVLLPYQEGYEDGPIKAARLAYSFADAMIQERAKS